MRSLRLAAVPFVLFACGDNHDQQMPVDANRPDTMVDAPPVPTCEFNEANDAGNDDLFGTGTPEATNIAFAATKMTVCGSLNTGHFDTNSLLIDSDSYTVHVPTSRGARVTLTGPGAEALNTVLIEIYDNVSGTDAVGTFLGNHAAAGVDLVAGDYTITVSAFHTTAPAAAIPYRLTLWPVDLAMACPHVTTTASYTEANDLVTADGNDVYEVRYGSATPHRKFTDNALDAPENTTTAFTIAPAMNYRVTGVNSSPTVTPADWADRYQDRDTYAIKTGANTNEVSLRLNWPGTTMDMDMLVFKENDLTDFADAFLNGNMEPEFLTIAVQPNSTYWVFVAADDASTGQPVNYDLTVCGATFAP
ncbi:MAG TPA: hypothetical protein VMZ53_06375 [Kofleriaceae bacterium]|nr:hypothetical protein [Kofleriaceae bacterium]